MAHDRWIRTLQGSGIDLSPRAWHEALCRWTAAAIERGALAFEAADAVYGELDRIGTERYAKGVA